MTKSSLSLQVLYSTDTKTVEIFFLIFFRITYNLMGYLFRGDLQITVLDHNPLHEQGTGTESFSRKSKPEERSEHRLNSCIYSIRDQAQVVS